MPDTTKKTCVQGAPRVSVRSCRTSTWQRRARASASRRLAGMSLKKGARLVTQSQMNLRVGHAGRGRALRCVCVPLLILLRALRCVCAAAAPCRGLWCEELQGMMMCGYDEQVGRARGWATCSRDQLHK